MQYFLHPVDALKPSQFNHTRSISQIRHQSARPLFTYDFHGNQSAPNLNKIHGRNNRSDGRNFCLINMLKWKIIQQIFKSENLQLLLQHVGSQWTNTFQVFNWIGQYGCFGGYFFIFKIKSISI